MTVFAHFDDPVFEQHGGIYVPYSSLDEAKAQVASDILSVNNDLSAVNLLSIFEAEYGNYKKVTPQTVDGYGNITPAQYDYNAPLGHLDCECRKELVVPSSNFETELKKIQVDQMEASQKGLADFLLDQHNKLMEGSLVEGSVPAAAFVISSGGTSTGGAIALVAATAKTVIGLAAGSTGPPAICEISVSFDGVTASAVPVLVETVSGTNATNPPGTASTSQTAKQIRGWPAYAAVTTGAYNWTTEPTVLEVFKKRLLTPNGGILVIQFPLGREPSSIPTAATQFKFIGLRLTAPAGVNVHADLEFEE